MNKQEHHSCRRPRGENSHIYIQYIYTIINLIGLLDYHYLQTANGAIVGNQQSIFNSQLFLLQANSHIRSSILLLIADCMGEWATEQQANCLTALVHKSKKRFNKHLHCMTWKSWAHWQIGHTQPKHKDIAITNLQIFSSNYVILMLNEWLICYSVMKTPCLFSSLDASILGSLFVPVKSFTTQKTVAAAEAKKPSSYFITMTARK